MNNLSSCHSHGYHKNNAFTPQTYFFAYTGADQSSTIPTGATNVYIQCWGAGGATSGRGALNYITGSSGGGGYTDAYFSVTSYVGTSLKVIVGGGGTFSINGAVANGTYGGGGSSGPSDGNWGASSGGGRSAVRLYVSSSYVEIITSGGGGAGGQSTFSGGVDTYSTGGAGGGSVGGNAHQTEGGTGGTQSAGGNKGTTSDVNVDTGVAGSQYTGGNGGTYSHGGGGGWYGGGGGGVADSYRFGGGGGGSSYINNTYKNSGFSTTMTQGSSYSVANNTGLPSNVIGTIGSGVLATGTNSGSGNGKHGYIIITFS